MAQNIKFSRLMAREMLLDWNDRRIWNNGDFTWEFYFDGDWINDAGTDEVVITDTRKHLKSIINTLIDQGIEFSVY